MARKIDNQVGMHGMHGNYWMPIRVDANGNISAATTLSASELHIGQVGGESDQSAVAPVLAVAGAYVAGDAVGGIMEFTQVARVDGLGAILKSLEIIALTTDKPTLELWLFDRAFTPATDNDPFSVSDADIQNVVCVITTSNGDFFTTADQAVASIEVSKRIKPLATSLFGQLVTRTSVTYTDADLMVKLSYLQD